MAIFTPMYGSGDENDHDGIRRRDEWGLSEWCWRSGDSILVETRGSDEWRCWIRVGYVRIECMVWLLMNIGVD